MTPLQRKTALQKLYFRLQKDIALCQQLGLSNVGIKLQRHAERIGVLAEAVKIRKMSRGKKDPSKAATDQ